MHDDTQIKHHIWWIIKTIGATGEYKDFIHEDLSDETVGELSTLINYIKENYE